MVKYCSSKLAQKKKKIFRLKFILSAVVLISFVFSLSALSKSDFLSIKKIEIVGNKVIGKNTLEKATSDSLLGEYFWLFKKRNILIYPKQAIKDEIIKEFPRIKKVDFDLDLPNLLNINITERSPYVLWCGNASTTECFLVDGEGYIFSYLDNVTGDNTFRYYTNLGDQLLNNQIITKKIFEESFFSEVDSFIQFIKGLNLEPYKLVENGNKYEIYFGDQNSKIIFNKGQSVKEVMINLQAILNMEEFLNIENFKKLQYIDLRFGNKVFYK